MRIWGYLLLIAGTLFLILFLFAQLGGGHVGVLPFLISAFIAAMGWSFLKSGKAIEQTQGLRIERAEPATVRMPMTPAVAAVVARQSAKDWRRVLYVAGGMFLLIVIIGAVAALADTARAAAMLGIFGATGAVTAALIVGIAWLGMRMPVRRDLRSEYYLRTSGPMQVVSIPFTTGATLRLADRAFLVNGTAAIRELGSIDGGTVDHTPHGHVILAAWDSTGRNVYVSPGYEIKERA